MKFRRAFAIAAAAAGSLALIYGCGRAAVPGEPIRITALPAPIETVTYDEFVATLGMLQIAECRTRPRRAGVGPKPPTTPVQICAIQGAQYGGGANTSHNGDIVARLIRRGNNPDTRWNMERSPIEYYMVLSQRNNVVSYHMAKLNRAASELTIGDAYQWGPCGGTHTRPLVARASFRDCGSGPPNASDPPDPTPLQQGASALWKRLSPVSVAFAAAALPGFDSPEWVDCQDGCCTGSQAPALAR